MLSKAKKGVRTTQIMFECKMNFGQLKVYLHLLLKQGLIEKDGGIYRTTEKGVCFLKKFREMDALLNDAPQAGV